jgi:hypothetical protein
MQSDQNLIILLQKIGRFKFTFYFPFIAESINTFLKIPFTPYF